MPGRELVPNAPADLAVGLLEMDFGSTLGSAATDLPFSFGLIADVASFAVSSCCDASCSDMFS